MDFTEKSLLEWVQKAAPLNETVLHGIGDDAAVLHYLDDGYQLFKVDAIAEGSHFLPGTQAALIGRKALARPLSDIAAMGGIPDSAIVTLAIDAKKQFYFLQEIFEGMFSLARNYNIALVGGDTIKIDNGMVISVSVLGKVKKDHLCLRKGATPGDVIMITGKIGNAEEGKHLSFEPRLTESQWLVTNFNISSMMDISDGLTGDLLKIVTINHAGAILYLKSIPLDKDTVNVKKALTSGEEYELLFTCSQKESEKILSTARNFNTDITVIGEITAQEEKIVLVDQQGRATTFNDTGFDHFK